MSPAPAPARQPARRPAGDGPAVRHLQVVTDPGALIRARRRRRLFTIITVVLALGGMFAIVGLQVFLTQGQGQLDTLEATVETEQARQQELRLRLAELEAPSRIVGEARQRLGMVPVKSLTYLAPPDAPPSAAPIITVATAIPTTTTPPATTPSSTASAGPGRPPRTKPSTATATTPAATATKPATTATTAASTPTSSAAVTSAVAADADEHAE